MRPWQDDLVEVRILRPCRGPRGRRCKPGEVVKLRRGAARAFVSSGRAAELKVVDVPEVKTLEEPAPSPQEPRPPPPPRFVVPDLQNMNAVEAIAWARAEKSVRNLERAAFLETTGRNRKTVMQIIDSRIAFLEGE
jgi:hypothetical protein